MNLSPVVRIERVKIDIKQLGSDTSSRTQVPTRSLRSSQKSPDVPKHFYSTSTYQIPESLDSDEEFFDDDLIIEEELISAEETKDPESSDNEPRGRLFGGLKKIDFDPKVDAPPGSCLQCHKEGHSYVKCPNPKRQNCFNCGRWNTLVTICPRCSDAYKRAMTEGKLGKAKYANSKHEDGKSALPKDEEKDANGVKPDESSEIKEETKEIRIVTPDISSKIKVVHEKPKDVEEIKPESQETKVEEPEIQEIKEEKKVKPGVIRLTRLSRQQKIDEPASEPVKPGVIRLTRLNRQQKIEEPEPEVKTSENVEEKEQTSEPDIQILCERVKAPEPKVQAVEEVKTLEPEVEIQEVEKISEPDIQEMETSESETVKMDISEPEIEKAKTPEPEVIELELEEHFESMEELAEDSGTKQAVEELTKDSEANKEPVEEPQKQLQKIDLPGLGEGKDLGVDVSTVPKGRFFDPKVTVPFDPKIDPPPGTCYQCHKPGHEFEDCADERKVCLNCGRWSVGIRQCPRCSRFYRSMPKPSLNSRSTKASKRFVDTLKINPQNNGFIHAVKAAFRKRLRSQLFPRLLLSVSYMKRIDVLGKECLKCHRVGHEWYKCPANQNRTWCISCGRWDVGVEDCPRCREAFNIFWSKECETWDPKLNYPLPDEKQSEKDSNNSEKKSHKNCSECVDQFKCHEAGHWRDNVKNLTRMFKCTGCDWMGILVIDCPRCEEFKGKSSNRQSRNKSKEREEIQITQDAAKSENRSRNKSKERTETQVVKDVAQSESRSRNKSKEREETQVIKDAAKSENRSRKKSKEREESQVSKNNTTSENPSRDRSKDREQEEPYVIREGTMFGNLKMVEFDPKLDPPERGCFACHRKGHIVARCPTKKRDGWCLNCGRRGVNVADCPRCSEGNKVYLMNRAKEYYGKEGTNPKKRNLELEKKFKRFYLVGTSFSGLELVEFDPKLDSPMGACFQCHNKGHSWAKCPEGKSGSEKRVWCSNCGRWDVYVTECPRCKEAYKRHFKITDEELARRNKEREKDRIREKEKEKEKEKERERERERGKRDNRKRKAEDEGSSQPPSKKVAEFSFKMEGTAFGNLKNIPFDLLLDAPSKACFQCHKPGHSWSKCPNPKRSIWCFNCGRWEVQADNCPRCSEAHKIYVKEQDQRKGRSDKNRDKGRDRVREKEKERDRERETDKPYNIPKLVAYPHLDKEYSTAGHNKKMDAETAGKPYYMTVDPQQETDQHRSSQNTQKIDSMIFENQVVSSITGDGFFQSAQDIRNQSSAEFFRPSRRGPEGDFDQPWESDSGPNRPWQPFTSAMEETRREHQTIAGGLGPWGNQGNQMMMEQQGWENPNWRDQGNPQLRQENRDWLNQENQENRQANRDWFDQGGQQNMKDGGDWCDRRGQQHRQEDRDLVDRESQKNRRENRDWPNRENDLNRQDDRNWSNQEGQQNRRNERDRSDRGGRERRRDDRDLGGRGDREGQPRREEDRSRNDRGGQQRRQDERDRAQREGQQRRQGDDTDYRSGPMGRQTDPAQKTDWAPFGNQTANPWQQPQGMGIEPNQFADQGLPQGQFGNQRPPPDLFNQGLPQNQFVNREFPQGQFVNQGPPQNRFDNQGPPQLSFDSQGPNPIINQKPLPGLFDNQVILHNKFGGNLGPPQGQFIQQEPIVNQMDIQGSRQNKFVDQDLPTQQMKINDQSKRSGKDKSKQREKDAPRKEPNQLAFLNSIGSILGRLTEEINPPPTADEQPTWSNAYNRTSSQSRPNDDQMTQKPEGRKAARAGRGSRWGPPAPETVQPPKLHEGKSNPQTFETDPYRSAQQQPRQFDRSHEKLQAPDNNSYGQQINPYQSNQMTGLDRSGHGQIQTQGPIDPYRNQGQDQSNIYRPQQMQAPDKPQQNQMQQDNRSDYGQVRTQTNLYQTTSFRSNQMQSGGQSYGRDQLQEQTDPYRSRQMQAVEREPQRPKQMQEVDPYHPNQIQAPHIDPYQSSKAGYGQAEPNRFQQMQAKNEPGYGQNQGVDKPAYGQVETYHSNKSGYKQEREVDKSGYRQSEPDHSRPMRREDRSGFTQAESYEPRKMQSANQPSYGQTDPYHSNQMQATEKSNYGQADSYRTTQVQTTDKSSYGQPDFYHSNQMQTSDKNRHNQADSYRSGQIQAVDKSKYDPEDPYRSNQMQTTGKSSHNQADPYRSNQMQAAGQAGYGQADVYSSNQMQTADKAGYNRADPYRPGQKQVPDLPSGYQQADSYRSNQMQAVDKPGYNPADSYHPGQKQAVDKSNYSQTDSYRANDMQTTNVSTYGQVDTYRTGQKQPVADNQAQVIPDAYAARQSQAQVDPYQRQRQSNTYKPQNPSSDPNPNYYHPTSRSTGEPSNQAVTGSSYSGYSQAGQTREGSNWETYKTSSFQTSQKHSNERVVNNPNSNCPEPQISNPKQQRVVQAPMSTSNPSSSQSSSSLTPEQMKKLAALTPSSQAFMSTLFLKKIAGFDEILNLFSAMVAEAQESFIVQLKQAGY